MLSIDKIKTIKNLTSYSILLLSITISFSAKVHSANPIVQITKPGGMPELTQIIERNIPTVVNIRTSKDAVNYKKLIKLPPELEGTPQGDLFKKFFEDQEEQSQDASLSLGSGVIISKDGYIATNQHVISNADRILVKFDDKREFPAKVVGIDKSTDLALLKINANDLPFATLGDSDKLKVGEWVVAIGSPFGFGHSATAGIISGKGRRIGREIVPFIQTDAAINPGNSGGPLFNMDGDIIGINSQILSKSGGYLGLSFAVPSNVLRNVVTQLKNYGYVAHGYLGLSFQEMTGDIAKSFGLDRPSGALVANIVLDSPAAKAGLKMGDIILKLNDVKILDAEQLPALVGNIKPGTQVKLTLFRAGKEQELMITIGQLERDEINKVEGFKEKSDKSEDTANYDVLGLKVRDLNEEDRKRFEVDKGGVIITKIDPDGIATDMGLSNGLVILGLNLQNILDSKEYNKIVKSLPEDKLITILVKNDSGSKRYFAFKITK